MSLSCPQICLSRNNSIRRCLFRLSQHMAVPLKAVTAAQAKEGEALLTTGRKHRTAALQAAEVIALQAEQSELADLIDEEEAEGLEPVRGPFDPLTSQVAKGPRTIRKRNPEGGHAGNSPTARIPQMHQHFPDNPSCS